MPSSASQPQPQDPLEMARNFLSQAASVHPALAGELAGELEEEQAGESAAVGGEGEPRGALWLPDPDRVTAGVDNSLAIGEIYSYWRDHFPEGGHPYWSVRTWTMLIWQPAFLSVIAVHGSGFALDLERLQQKRNGGVVAGFRLLDEGFAGRPADAIEAALIRSAGHGLRTLADKLLAELTRITRLKPLSARRLLADSLLAAVARVEHLQPRVGHRRIMDLAGDWLEAAGLAGESGLVPLGLKDGRIALGLDRKGCCMHYRRKDGELCASCPKLKRPERLRRMQAQLNLDADAD